MKIISWNVNGVRAAYKKGLPDFVKNYSPDVLCLQETKAHPDQVGPDIMNLSGTWSIWASALKKGYSGVATFCKEPPQASVVGLGIEDLDIEGRTVITDHGDFLLYNIYFPNGQRDQIRQDYKMKFNRALHEHLITQIKKGREVVVVGDYNIAPTEMDIYDPTKFAKTSGFLPIEREWLQDLFKSGFVDTFRHIYPEEREKYTWWNQIDRSRLGNRGWRIDLMCVTKGLVGRIKSVGVLDDVEGSDHCPTLLEF